MTDCTLGELLANLRRCGRGTEGNQALGDLVQEVGEAAARTTFTKGGQRGLRPALLFTVPISTCQCGEDPLGAALRTFISRGE